MPELRGQFEQILNVARCHSRRVVGNIELADRLLDAVVAWAEIPAAAIPLPKENNE
jgi:hypothetical protein